MYRTVGILVVLTLLGTACSSGTPDTAPTTESPSRTASAGAASEQRGPAEPVPYEVPFELEFTATLIGGDPFDGTSVAGKDVLFWFWAPS